MCTKSILISFIYILSTTCIFAESASTNEQTSLAKNDYLIAIDDPSVTFKHYPGSHCYFNRVRPRPAGAFVNDPEDFKDTNVRVSGHTLYNNTNSSKKIICALSADNQLNASNVNYGRLRIRKFCGEIRGKITATDTLIGGNRVVNDCTSNDVSDQGLQFSSSTRVKLCIGDSGSNGQLCGENTFAPLNFRGTVELVAPRPTETAFVASTIFSPGTQLGPNEDFIDTHTANNVLAPIYLEIFLGAYTSIYSARFDDHNGLRLSDFVKDIDIELIRDLLLKK